MTPAYRELVAALRREGSALLAAAQLGTDTEVPACPGWTVDDLLVHVGRLWGYVAGLVSTRATGPSRRPPMPDGDRIAVATELLDELVEQLGSVEPETPVWNWSSQPDNAAFWARRMVQETAVHRYDAQRAHGVAQPIDDDLALDGIDEFIDVLVPVILSRDHRALSPGAVVLRTVDDGDIPLLLEADGLRRSDVPAAGATIATATASTLLLACAGRITWENLDVEGDRAVLDGWSEALQF